jgi:hypothetical protein
MVSFGKKKGNFGVLAYGQTVGFCVRHYSHDDDDDVDDDDDGMIRAPPRSHSSRCWVARSLGDLSLTSPSHMGWASAVCAVALDSAWRAKCQSYH